MTGSDNDMRDQMAGEYVLGTLSPAARRTFERDLADDAALREVVAAWEQRLGAIAVALPAEPPPPGLKDKVNKQIDREALNDGYIRRAAEAEWTQVRPGLSRRRLKVDAQNHGTALYQLAPRAIIPSESHDADEECLVLEGELIIDNVRFAPGDYCCIRQGGKHGVITTERGALFLVVGRVP